MPDAVHQSLCGDYNAMDHEEYQQLVKDMRTAFARIWFSNDGVYDCLTQMDDGMVETLINNSRDPGQYHLANYERMLSLAQTFSVWKPMQDVTRLAVHVLEWSHIEVTLWLPLTESLGMQISDELAIKLVREMEEYVWTAEE
jgi:hypothetical protein